MVNKKRVFRLLSLLFQYPEEWFDYDLFEETKSIEDFEIKTLIENFILALNNKDREEVVEQYISTFDFNENTNLYLTYAKLKDERKRGEVLAELKNLYMDAGLYMYNDELPDYLPLVLEFIAVAPENLTEQIYQQFKPALEILQEELRKIDSPYIALITAIFLGMERITRFVHS